MRTNGPSPCSTPVSVRTELRTLRLEMQATMKVSRDKATAIEAMLWCAMLYCAMLYCTVLCYAAMYCIVLCSTVLCCAMQYCTVLSCNVLCCAMLCHAVTVTVTVTSPSSESPLNWMK
jgi:hypothetical protein